MLLLLREKREMHFNYVYESSSDAVTHRIHANKCECTEEEKENEREREKQKKGNAIQ